MYKRPHHMPTVIKAWRGQTVQPYKIIVVDNSPPECGEECYPNYVLDGADDVWRIKNNLGASCRFAPALMIYGHDYVVLADDDVLPGRKAVEYGLQTATRLNNEFATIGSYPACRIFNMNLPSGERYIQRPATANYNSPVKCPLTCNIHLVRSDVFGHVLNFRDDLLKVGAGGLVDIHDDFLLCCGVQRYTGWASYVTALPRDREQLIMRQRLEEGDVALWKRPQHFIERNKMIDLCLEAGWKPV